MVVAIFIEGWKGPSVKQEALLLWETIGASVLMLAPWPFREGALTFLCFS